LELSFNSYPEKNESSSFEITSLYKNNEGLPPGTPFA
jgi:hypothetical protein